jgi:hypothetical protein
MIGADGRFAAHPREYESADVEPALLLYLKSARVRVGA